MYVVKFALLFIVVVILSISCVLTEKITKGIKFLSDMDILTSPLNHIQLYFLLLSSFTILIYILVYSNKVIKIPHHIKVHSPKTHERSKGQVYIQPMTGNLLNHSSYMSYVGTGSFGNRREIWI